MRLVAFILIIGFVFSETLFSFPEMIRHHYSNCTSCHVSPSGSGLLTPYGRALSGEILSMGSKENEGEFLWGAMKTPQAFQLGGDLRFLQIYRNNDAVEEARFFTMQADLEGALSYEKLQAVATIGKSDADKPANLEEALVSHRHYLLYRPMETMAVRLGRFQKSFGINTPDHIIVTKKGLKWDQNTETYNLEFSLLNESYDLFVTGMFGRIDNSEVKRDRGVAFRAGYNINEGAKIGISYLYGDNETTKRHVFGPFAMVGFTSKFYLLEEIDFQKNQNGPFGWVQYSKLGYTVIKGLDLYLNHEYSKLDLENEKTLIHSYGLGFQWYPRPHFEISALYQRQKVLFASDSYGDLAWVIFHYYP